MKSSASFVLFTLTTIIAISSLPAFAQREAVPEGGANQPTSGGKCITYVTSQAQPQKMFDTPVSKVVSVSGSISFDGNPVPLQGLPVESYLNKARMVTQPFGAVLIDSTTDHFFLGTGGKTFTPSKRVSILLNVKGKLIQDKRAIGNVTVCFE
jgi:hypothetical protein